MNYQGQHISVNDSAGRAPHSVGSAAKHLQCVRLPWLPISATLPSSVWLQPCSCGQPQQRQQRRGTCTRPPAPGSTSAAPLLLHQLLHHQGQQVSPPVGCRSSCGAGVPEIRPWTRSDSPPALQLRTAGRTAAGRAAAWLRSSASVGGRAPPADPAAAACGADPSGSEGGSDAGQAPQPEAAKPEPQEDLGKLAIQASEDQWQRCNRPPSRLTHLLSAAAVGWIPPPFQLQDRCLKEAINPAA